MRPSQLLLALLAGLVLTVAGCGSSGSQKGPNKAKADDTPTPGKHKPTGKQDPGDGEQEADPKLCGKLGITPDSSKQGRCHVQQGAKTHSVLFVNGRSTLNLDELDLKVKKVTTPASISGPSGSISPQNGTDKNGKTIEKAFVVVEMTWKNKGNKSRRLNVLGKQIKLGSAGGGGPVYPLGERSEPDSFYNAKALKPGATQTGVAVYQVPVEVAKAIALRGAHPELMVWEFSTAGKPKAAPAGFIRLWNV
jgi:hypothetical protein